MKKKQARKPPKKMTSSSLQKLKQVEKKLREVTHERDLYRKEWHKIMEDIVPYKITKEEIDAINKEGITLESMIAEIKPLLKKKPA
jgi:flagellar biosynthesis chaperone FliJ